MSVLNQLKDTLSDKRKLFVIVSIVVPFIIYCMFYYSNMIRNAPFRSDEFVGIAYSEWMNGKLIEQLDTRNGRYLYVTRSDSVKTAKVSIPKAELRTLHFKMMDLLFFDIRSLGDSNMRKLPHSVYLINAFYRRKQKTVWWQSHYSRDEKLEKRMQEMTRTLHTLAEKHLVE